ncbi:MAG: NgoMIV family type II restriction endonuclease [Sporichthyaceae bacterium]
MSAPAWVRELLGWKPTTKKSKAACLDLFGEALAPNLADVGSKGSLRLAGEVYRAVGVGMTKRTTTTLADDTTESADETATLKVSSAGSALENGIREDVKAALAHLDDSRRWLIQRGGDVSRYAQFEHLKTLQALFDEYPTLRATLGRDYQVATDVYVGVAHPEDTEASPFLHAAISSKWTIRSDRVQNVRHEFATLVRNRRGRLPHLVLVTAEPLPSRLISIARGTGEVDAVYHLLYDELANAVPTHANQKENACWTEMVEQRRIRSYGELARDLTLS